MVSVSNVELDSIYKFRKSVRDVYETHWAGDTEEEKLVFLWKWLKARNFDPIQSEQMLRKSISWRQLNRIGDLNNLKPSEKIERYLSFAISLGPDITERYNVYLTQYGSTDHIGLLRTYSVRALYEAGLWWKEHSVLQRKLLSKQYGKLFSQDIIIMDMSGLDVSAFISHEHFQWLKLINNAYEANYPEEVKQIFMINPPILMKLIWSMFSKLASKGTKDKVDVLFGSDWKEYLATNIISKKFLPKYLGGTKEKLDGVLNSSDVFTGNRIPRHLYQPEEEVCSLKKVGYRFVVGRSSVKRIQYVSTSSTALLKWKFCTDDYDIAFGIFDKEGAPLIQKMRTLSHWVIEKGELPSHQNSKWVLEFDNSYSYWRSKTVYLQVEIIEK